MKFIAVVFFLGAVLAFLPGCQKEDPCKCGSCPENRLCLARHHLCVPVPDSANACPAGYTFNGCSAEACCEICHVCVPLCIPDGLR